MSLIHRWTCNEAQLHTDENEFYKEKLLSWNAYLTSSEGINIRRTETCSLMVI